MRTAQDFLSLTSKIQMDLAAAQAKLTELRAWIAGLDLPTEDQPFSEANGMALVRNTGHEYTPASLAAELEARGASQEFIVRALAEAAK